MWVLVLISTPLWCHLRDRVAAEVEEVGDDSEDIEKF